MNTHPLLARAPGLHDKLKRGHRAFGYFLLSGDSMIAETLGTMPIDWLLVDMEASPVTKQGALHVLQALNGSGTAPLIRVPSLDRHLIEHALDVGAEGVLVPKVDTPEQAAAAAAACRFPPVGERGINPVRASGYFADVPGYLAAANERTLCLVQAESAAAVERAHEIASVAGVDVVFVGAGDLASSLGQPGVVEGGAMDGAVQAVLDATLAARKVPGIFAYSLELALRYAEQGFRFIALGNDIKVVREKVTQDLLAVARHR